MIKFAYAIALVFGTTSIHAIATLAIIQWFRSLHVDHWVMGSTARRILSLAVLVFLMSFVAYLEALLWASFYVFMGALASFEDAFYFSIVTFTTLGYGDITLDEYWRGLGAFEAANGIILFGWTTAIIVAAVQRVFAVPSAPELVRDDS